MKKASVLEFKKMIIALAGPITNILIIIVGIFFQKYINESLYSQIIYANILIAIFNLLPIYPLDGGRFLKSIIYILKGNKKSNEYINFISNISVIFLTIMSIFLLYYYKNIAILFIIVYLWGVIIIENKKYNTRRRIYNVIANKIG